MDSDGPAIGGDGWNVYVSVKGGGMKRINLWSFYRLSKTLQRLRALESDTPVKDALWPVRQCQEELTEFDRDWFQPLRICRGATLSKLNKELADIAATPSDQSVGFGAYITIPLSEFETVVAHDLQRVCAYMVPQRGIFDTILLVEKAEEGLSERARQVIDAAAIQDIREAGRCIAFDLGTAASFHTWRAAETVLRQCFDALSGGQDRLRHGTWAAYVQKLEELGADERVVAVVRQLGSLHRNPTMHPEQFIALDESIRLFGLAIDAIEEMARLVAKVITNREEELDRDPLL